MAACGCGCEADAGLYTRTNRKYGYVRGAERRFVPGHSRAKIALYQGVPADERRRLLKNAKNARWYARSRPARLTKARSYAATHSAEAVARVRTWREENPERARALRRAHQSARRARLLGAFVEVVDPQVVWERDEGICGICNEAADPADWHLDHVTPLSKGGEHSYANTQVAHGVCNVRKGARV